MYTDEVSYLLKRTLFHRLGLRHNKGGQCCLPCSRKTCYVFVFEMVAFGILYQLGSELLNSKPTYIWPGKAPLGRPNAYYARRERPLHARRHDMAWVILFFAGLLEVAWALLLKQSEGFT